MLYGEHIPLVLRFASGTTFVLRKTTYKGLQRPTVQSPTDLLGSGGGSIARTRVPVVLIVTRTSSQIRPAITVALPPCTLAVLPARNCLENTWEKTVKSPVPPGAIGQLLLLRRRDPAHLAGASNSQGASHVPPGHVLVNGLLNYLKKVIKKRDKKILFQLH